MNLSAINRLATEEHFSYLSYNFFNTYLQFRLKYFIHDNQQSLEYRKLKTLWDGILVGLECSYIIGLARIALPPASKNGKQRYPNQVSIHTWLPTFTIKDKVAEKHLIDWRHKALGHIDVGMKGMTDRNLMTILMDEVMSAMDVISKTYTPNLDYKASLEHLAEHGENDFIKLLGVIKTHL